ncbi:hepatitis A virus cellular receptor 2 homolog isoform X2 [Paramormyrops kingsleyae]|uniref:hepatitis A virus cellular receptor 2 homolog isoform X2 n=1 Tax=Paramormyrops kingsleyae TaxID=1676925 RepID=UPI003B97ADB7
MAVHGHCMPALLLILFHIMPVAVSSKMITGFVGYNVTLPCSYDAEYYGGLHVCWGRGEIPQLGCGNEIIVTDGLKVTRRTSHRYQLIGDQKQGDVSLTIIDAEMGDSGIYGCRVEIPGLFNDLKSQVNLTIQNILQSPTDAASPVTQTAISLMLGYYGNYSTGSSTANTPQGSDHADRSFLIRASVIMLLLLLVLVTGHWLHKRKRQREARTLAAVEHQTDVSVHYRIMGDEIGFHPRRTAIENVYELRDFGDCEYRP